MRLVGEPQDYIQPWLCERIGYIPTRDMFVIGQWCDEKKDLIGAVGFDGWSEVMVEMHCAGDKDRRWLNEELLFHAFNHPFIVHGMKVVLSRVSSFNPAAIEFNRKLGFQEQCRIPDGADDGDLVISTMHREQCKWLSLNSRLKEAA